MKRALTVLAILLPASAAVADDTTAVALHDQGIKDMQAGNLDAGCKELAKSLSLAPDSGTQGALATCYTRQNKLASAWTLWKNLADTETNADLRDDARKLAAQLEARLPHFVVHVVGPAAPGLAITVNGVDVDPSLPVPLPIDPGPVAASAHAPGRADWSQTFTATEGALLAIEVPALPELAKPPPAVTSVVPSSSTPLPSAPIEDHAAARHTHHVTGVVLVAAGLVGVAAGSVFGLDASSKWSDAKSTCGGSIDRCTTAQSSTAQGQVNSARSAALGSTIGFAVGGAAVALGAYFYLSAPGDREHAPTALRITPAIGGSSYGVALGGGW